MNHNKLKEQKIGLSGYWKEVSYGAWVFTINPKHQLQAQLNLGTKVHISHVDSISFFFSYGVIRVTIVLFKKSLTSCFLTSEIVLYRYKF